MLLLTFSRLGEKSPQATFTRTNPAVHRMPPVRSPMTTVRPSSGPSMFPVTVSASTKLRHYSSSLLRPSPTSTVQLHPCPPNLFTDYVYTLPANNYTHSNFQGSLSPTDNDNISSSLPIFLPVARHSPCSVNSCTMLVISLLPVHPLHCKVVVVIGQLTISHRKW